MPAHTLKNKTSNSHIRLELISEILEVSCSTNWANENVVVHTLCINSISFGTNGLPILQRLVTIWEKRDFYFETAGLIFITIAPTIANSKIRDVIISHKK